MNINYEKMFDELIEEAKASVPPENSFTSLEFIERTGMSEPSARSFLRAKVDTKELKVLKYKGRNYYYFPA